MTLPTAAPEPCDLKIRSQKTIYFLSLFIKTQAKERPGDVSRKLRNILREATEKGLQQGRHHKVG